jgi:hypothetical protein
VKAAKDDAPAAEVLALPEAAWVGSVAAADGITLLPRCGKVALQGEDHPASGSAAIGISSLLLGLIEAGEGLREEALL